MFRTTNERLVAVCAGFFLVLQVLWVRCVWLQGLHGPVLAQAARAQYRLSERLVAPRGAVRDRGGRVLAMSVRAPSVYANPRQMSSKADTAIRVARVLDRDAGRLQAKLSRDKGFVWLARHVDPALTDELAVFRRAGVGLIEEGQRLYPQGQLASHLLGSVDIDQRGLEGVELEYDGVLRGRAGWASTWRDARGERLIGPWTVEAEPEPGDDVVLTIDSVVQAAAEEALAWGVKQFHAKGGSIILLEPSSGAVLAMANLPDFDPQHPAHAAPEARRNRAITDLFEPGSIFKIVTAAALLEEGKARPEERVFCEQGSFPTVARHVLHDHRPHGWLSFHDVIAYSSNIGTAKLATRLTPETLYRYIRALGFGQPTGIELRGEISGMVHPPATWSKLSPYIIPIGQEIGVTPIQLAVMTATIANGGWRVRPYVIEEIQTPTGRIVRRHAPVPPQRVLKSTTVAQLSEMLVSVVESGTGQQASVQGLTVAGKTGTAQKLEPTGHYSHSRYVASFVGYGPVPAPRFAMVVSIDEPHPLYFGGVVAAPIFRRVVQQLAGYWGVQPSPRPATLAQLSP